MNSTNLNIEMQKYIRQELIMCREKNRLNSFKSWIFKPNKPCSAERLAEAGFYFIGDKSEPDAVRCFMCEKSLDSWDEDDDPWSEHLKHSPNCEFAKQQRSELIITVVQLQEIKDKLIIRAMNKFFNKQLEELEGQINGLASERVIR